MLKPFPNETGETQTVEGNGHIENGKIEEVEQNRQPETPQVDEGGQVETTAQKREIIDVLKVQLEGSKERETKLLSMLSEQQKLLSEEQQRTKMLMPPPDEQQQKKKPSFFGYFRIKR